MMQTQLLRYAPFYGAVAALAFISGWCACAYLSDRMDRFDPRIGQGKYGW